MIDIRQKIAVIGSGIAGVSSCYMLDRTHEVTLFECNEYLGGHTNTRTIESGPDEGTQIDTGFIVCNPDCYPIFYKFLDALGVSLRDSDMSFSYYRCADQFGYSGPRLREALSMPQNFFKPSFLRLLWDRVKFNTRALSDLAQNNIGSLPLGAYLDQLGCSASFRSQYLIPLAASIWSSPSGDVENMPAQSFLRFFKNHGMLELHKFPQWQTVSGGSCNYVSAFLKTFKGTVLLNNPVHSVERSQDGVVVHSNLGSKSFDKVIFACHADQVLALLAEPTQLEQKLFGEWNYSENQTYLHTDASFLPPQKGLWSSWNYMDATQSQKSYTKEADSYSRLAISYYMNRLQGLTTATPYIVTLNPWKTIPTENLIYSTTYTHPVFTARTVATQDQIKALNGQNNTFFCGSYLGYGFHEDAISSSNEVAKHFGLALCQ
jgi:predicted NAD/FAD-binding protein